MAGNGKYEDDTPPTWPGGVRVPRQTDPPPRPEDTRPTERVPPDEVPSGRTAYGYNERPRKRSWRPTGNGAGKMIVGVLLTALLTVAIPSAVMLYGDTRVDEAKIDELETELKTKADKEDVQKLRKGHHRIIMRIDQLADE
jgi:hypothetical protein